MLQLYRFLSSCSAIPLNYLIGKRTERGKEDPARVAERRGIASIERPAGSVIWVHAASVGEAVSSLALIDKIQSRDNQIKILLTTGTVTSAALMKSKLPKDVLHQFAPIDHPRWVNRFLDHWKPDIAVWLESELWPNILLSLKSRKIPAILANGRLSDKSYKRWKGFRGQAKKLLSCFQIVLAQSERDKEKFENLDAPACDYIGNLKFSAAPLPYDTSELEKLRHTVKSRPIWLAASTHTGEEEAAADIHKKLAMEFPSLLTIIVPRHPNRSQDIQLMLKAKGLSVAVRSDNMAIEPTTDIYLADTLGEMGLFYKLSPISLVGGSLVPDVGGHNPIEPAHLDSAVIFGPHMENCFDLAQAMCNDGAAYQLSAGEDPTSVITDYLSNKNRVLNSTKAGQFFVKQHSGIADKMADRILELKQNTRVG